MILVRLSLIVTMALVVACCGPKLNTQIPAWNGEIYKGESATASIVRRQSGNLISCTDPKVNEYLCMSGTDFISFYDTYVLGCRAWKDPKLSTVKIEIKKHKEATALIKKILKGETQSRVEEEDTDADSS